MTNSPAPLYFAFGASYDGDADAFGEDVPVMAVVRLDAAAFQNVDHFVGLVRGGYIDRAIVKLEPDAFRWVKKVGLLPDNTMAPIPGFALGSDVHLTEPHMLDGDLDDALDYQDECDLYTGTMSEPGLKIAMIDGCIRAVPTGDACLDHGRRISYAGIYADWSVIERVALNRFAKQPQAAAAELAASPSSLFDATDKATILAALTHYRDAGMGEPDNRSEELHAVATANEQVISMDAAGLADLIARVQSMAPVTLEPEPCLDDEPRAYYETVLQVKVLSEDTPAEGMSLEDIAEAVSVGDCVGQITHSVPRLISAQTAARRLTEMGSEPGFFRLNQDGTHEDDEGGEQAAARPKE